MSRGTSYASCTKYAIIDSKSHTKMRLANITCEIMQYEKRANIMLILQLQ